MDLKKVASVTLIAFVIFSVAFLAYKELGQGTNSAGAKIGGEQSNNEGTPGNKDAAGVGGIAVAVATGDEQISQDPQNTPGVEGQKALPEVNETTGTNSAGTPPVDGQAAQKPAVSEAPAADQAKAQAGANKVIAYYFHPKYTCGSCYITENYIKEALNQYPGQLQNGTLEFRSIDVDRPENRHFYRNTRWPRILWC